MILIILATISINVVLGENGLIRKTQEAKKFHLIEQDRERIEMELMGLHINAKKRGTPLTTDEVQKHFEDLDWIIDSEIESEDTVTVITENNLIYDIILKDKNESEVIYKDEYDGLPLPKLKLEILPIENLQSGVVKIKATAKVKEGQIIEKIENETTKEIKNYDENGVIFEVSESRVYTFKVTTNKGKTKTKQIEVFIVMGEDIQLQAEPLTARNTEKQEVQNGIEAGEIIVKIKYGEVNLENKDKYQYKVGNEEWKTVTDKENEIKVKNNGMVLARYFNGKNGVLIRDIKIENVDNIAPEEFTAKVSSRTDSSLTITANTTDYASEGANENIAGILRYEYSVDGQKWQTSNVLNNLKDGTEYEVQVKAIDNAGNQTISKVTETTLESPYLVDKVSLGDYVAYDAGTWTSTRYFKICKCKFRGMDIRQK